MNILIINEAKSCFDNFIVRAGMFEYKDPAKGWEWRIAKYPVYVTDTGANEELEADVCADVFLAWYMCRDPRVKQTPERLEMPKAALEYWRDVGRKTIRFGFMLNMAAQTVIGIKWAEVFAAEMARHAKDDFPELGVDEFPAMLDTYLDTAIKTLDAEFNRAKISIEKQEYSECGQQ